MIFFRNNLSTNNKLSSMAYYIMYMLYYNFEIDLKKIEISNFKYLLTTKSFIHVLGTG